MLYLSSAEIKEDNLPDMLVLPENKFAVLINENALSDDEISELYDILEKAEKRKGEQK